MRVVMQIDPVLEFFRNLTQDIRWRLPVHKTCPRLTAVGKTTGLNRVQTSTPALSSSSSRPARWVAHRVEGVAVVEEVMIVLVVARRPKGDDGMMRFGKDVRKLLIRKRKR